MNRLTIYCGWWKNTKINPKYKIIQNMFFKTKCLECGGTGIFECGIPEEKGICTPCKGTGLEYCGI